MIAPKPATSPQAGDQPWLHIGVTAHGAPYVVAYTNGAETVQLLNRSLKVTMGGVKFTIRRED